MAGVPVPERSNNSRYARVLAVSLQTVARDMHMCPTLPAADVEAIRAAVCDVQAAADGLQTDDSSSPDSLEFSSRVEMVFWQMEMVNMCQRLKKQDVSPFPVEIHGLLQLARRLTKILENPPKTPAQWRTSTSKNEAGNDENP